MQKGKQTACDAELCYCGLSDAGQHVHGKLLGHVLLCQCWTANLLSCVVSNVRDQISHRATCAISGWRPHAKSDLSASFFVLYSRSVSRTTATNPSLQNTRASLSPWSTPSFQVSLFCTHQTNSSTSRGRHASLSPAVMSAWCAGVVRFSVPVPKWRGPANAVWCHAKVTVCYCAESRPHHKSSDSVSLHDDSKTEFERRSGNAPRAVFVSHKNFQYELVYR